MSGSPGVSVHPVSGIRSSCLSRGVSLCSQISRKSFNSLRRFIHAATSNSALIASDPIPSRDSSRFASIIISTASFRFSRASGSVLPFAYLCRAVPRALPIHQSPSRSNTAVNLFMVDCSCGCLCDQVYYFACLIFILEINAGESHPLLGYNCPFHSR